MPEYDLDYEHRCPYVPPTKFFIDRPEPLLADIDDVTQRDADGRTVLHVLALHGCSDIILRVIQNKDTVIDATDNEGRTPLYMAAANGHELIVGMLLNNGANPDIKTKERVTADEAAEQQGYRRVTQRLETISRFLNHPDNHTIKTNSDKTLLYFAVEKGEKQLVKVLVRYVYPVEPDIVELAIQKGDKEILHYINKRANSSSSRNRVTL